MKVYFEQTGRGAKEISINIYVEPNTRGEAYHFNSLGEKICFSWVQPEKARVIDSDELPKILWESIQHGTSYGDIPADKEDDWTFDDLKYNKVNMSEVRAFREVKERIKGVHTIEDFKALYPTIKKSKRVDMEIIKKLYSLAEVEEIPMVNGEQGLYFFQNQLRYHALIIALGIDK